MKANETKLRPMLEGTKQYVVPLFQRPYSWKQQNWETLWDDIVELIKENEEREHFLGSMVTMPVPAAPEGVAKYVLIDGQQRLTTLLILLAVLRDHVRDEPGKLADKIDNLLLRNQYQEGKEQYKLLPTQADRDAFFAVMENSECSAESEIIKARKFFASKISKASAISSEAIHRTIVEQLIVVSISLDPDDNPYLIFESLNAKGRPLSQADLIRNYIFMRIDPDRQDDIYREFWIPMQNKIGDSLAEFIRHFLMREGAVVKEGDVYFFLKERTDKNSDQDVITLLKDLRQFSQYYERFLYPEREQNREICEGISRLNRLQVTITYPFLLNVFDDRANGRIAESEVIEILDILENFFIRRWVCGISTTGLNRLFPSLYGQVRVSPTIIDGIRDVLSTRNYPKDHEFRDRLINSQIYRSRGDLAKLTLERIEASYGHKELVELDNLTIEHVMPQTLSEKWKDSLGDDWKETHEQLLHTLGNLTLTAYNPTLSNSPWLQKREILSKSHIELNRYFQSLDRWAREEIRLRSNALADRALSIWSYFGSSGTPEETVTKRIPRAVILRGKRFSVSSWREVAQQILEIIAVEESDRFESIETQMSRLISRDPSRMRTARQLSNGYYFEVHLSAQDIYRMCERAINLAGMTTEDWQVELA